MRKASFIYTGFASEHISNIQNSSISRLFSKRGGGSVSRLLLPVRFHRGNILIAFLRSTEKTRGSPLPNEPIPQLQYTQRTRKACVARIESLRYVPKSELVRRFIPVTMCC